MVKKTVALLVGGWSAEREVSLEKGKAVEAALIDGGYNVKRIDVTQDLSALIAALTPKPDAVFNNLHGQGGEDGQIQGLLEILEIPYTHSGVLASAAGMDKSFSKKLASSVGVPVAEEVIETMANIVRRDVMPRPYVVKPVNEGSSVGIYLVQDGDNLPPVDVNDKAAQAKLMVERFIPGRELTVAVLDGKAQAVTEIISHTQFFDYAAKYSDTRTEYVMPAKIPAQIYESCLDFAERVYKIVGCEGLARCDFRYDDTVAGGAAGEENVIFLEINTQPGLTAESIGPSQVVYNGTSFTELCAHLVETASCEKTKQKSDQQKAVEQDAVIPKEAVKA